MHSKIVILGRKKGKWERRWGKRWNMNRNHKGFTEQKCNPEQEGDIRYNSNKLSMCELKRNQTLYPKRTPKWLNPHVTLPPTLQIQKELCGKHRQDLRLSQLGSHHGVHVSTPIGIKKNSMSKKDLCKVHFQMISRISNFPSKWILKWLTGFPASYCQSWGNSTQCLSSCPVLLKTKLMVLLAPPSANHSAAKTLASGTMHRRILFFNTI